MDVLCNLFEILAVLLIVQGLDAFSNEKFIYDKNAFNQLATGDELLPNSISALRSDVAFEQRTKRDLSKTISPNMPVYLSDYSKKVLEEDKVSVTCTGNSSNIQWLDPKKKVIEAKSTFSWSQNIYVELNSKKNTCQLTIKNPKLTNQGNYTCNLINKWRNSTAVFSLVVVKKPKASLYPDSKDINLEEGEDYTVTCTGNSNNINWTNNDGKPIHGSSRLQVTRDFGKNQTTLLFRNISTSEAGKYLCLVDNNGFKEDKKIKIAVSKIELSFIPNNYGQVAVKENQDFKIECKGSVHGLVWKFNGYEVQAYFDKTRGYSTGNSVNGHTMSKTLKFDELRRENSGQYTCSGISLYDGKMIEKSFFLKVEEITSLSVPILSPATNPVTIKMNSTYSVECQGDTEDVKWFHPNGSIVHEIRFLHDTLYTQRSGRKISLIFKHASLDQEGVYICRVSKGILHPQDKKLTVVVYEPAYFNGTEQKEVMVNSSNTAKLDCSVAGHPMPTVNWKFMDHIVRDGAKMKYNGTSLIITDTLYTDAGKYVCVASQPNIDGRTIEKAVNLHVQFRPYFPDGPRITVERLLKTSAILRCSCIANPAPKYTWYRYEQILTTYEGKNAESLTENIVEIPFSSTSHTGEYKCVAVNSLGWDSQSISVVPMSLPGVPTLIAHGSDSSSVKFRISMTKNSTIKWYEIEYHDSATKERKIVNEMVTDNNVTENSVLTISGLKKHTEYKLKTRANNAVGFSNFSQEITISTSYGFRVSASCLAFLSFFVIQLPSKLVSND